MAPSGLVISHQSFRGFILSSNHQRRGTRKMEVAKLLDIVILFERCKFGV